MKTSKNGECVEERELLIEPEYLQREVAFLHFKLLFFEKEPFMHHKYKK